MIAQPPLTNLQVELLDLYAARGFAAGELYMTADL